MTSPLRPHRLTNCLLAVLAFGLSLSAVNAAPPPLKVVGNQLLTTSGQPVRLRGVNCASLEWSNDGEGRIFKSVQVAVTEWHANLIRLPLSQDRWFGKGGDQPDNGDAYRALTKQIVDFCSDHSVYVMLDLHWSDAGDWGENMGQHNLPDRNSLVFWKDVATRYRDHPAVLFDLYNEPTRITWDQWFKGGNVTETDEKTKEVVSYKGIGLQALVDVVRSTSANNVIVAGGINWAYELEGIPGARELQDPHGNGVVYAIHPYPHAYENLGRETIAQWEARTAAFAKKLPVIVTEFGSIETMWPFPKEWNYDDEKWNREMLRVLEAREWNWTAWDFHIAASPCLISDWKYTPTPEFGVPVKDVLAKNVSSPAP